MKEYKSTRSFIINYKWAYCHKKYNTLYWISPVCGHDLKVLIFLYFPGYLMKSNYVIKNGPVKILE